MYHYKKFNIIDPNFEFWSEVDLGVCKQNGKQNTRVIIIFSMELKETVNRRRMKPNKFLSTKWL